MKIVVCIKQVPQTSHLEWNAATGRLDRDRVEGMMNPACRHALEAAIKLKEERGASVTVVSMGPPDAEEVLYEALARGADEAALVTSPALAGSDTLATSHVLAKFVQVVQPDFDLILCGSQTMDSETAQVGPQVAEELGVAGVAYAKSIKLGGSSVVVERLVDGFLEKLEMDLPGVITVTTENFTPRNVSLVDIETAFTDKTLRTLAPADLGLEENRVGQNGSATRILRVYPAETKKEGLVLTGPARNCVRDFFDRFADRLGGVMGRDLETKMD